LIFERNHNDLHLVGGLTVTMLVAGIRSHGGDLETLDVDYPLSIAADEILIDIGGAGIDNQDNIIRLRV
jgi:hypothetical protein